MPMVRPRVFAFGRTAMCFVLLCLGAVAPPVQNHAGGDQRQADDRERREAQPGERQ